MNLRTAEIGREYTVSDVNLNDRELTDFLFSLGCYRGERVTVIFRKRSGMVVSIKDGRYSIDNALAEAIEVSA
jgi:ferrous iron transport protein A